MAQKTATPPQIKVNYLNVCAPGDAEAKEISSALAKIPVKPRFGADFEVSRGLSSLSEDLLAAGEGAKMSDETPAISRWVRVRKEFPGQSQFINAQYSFSVTESHIVETLVFRSREARDLMQISLSDTVDSTEPASVVRGDTAADRIRIERFGKSSLVVARCKDSDQAKYEPLFQQASSLLAIYRKSLGVRGIVPSDLSKIPPPPKQAAKP